LFVVDSPPLRRNHPPPRLPGLEPGTRFFSGAIVYCGPGNFLNFCRIDTARDLAKIISSLRRKINDHEDIL